VYIKLGIVSLIVDVTMTASSQQSKIIPVNILLVGAKNEHKKDVVIYLLIEGEDR
jgi:hypothetical protein